MNCPKCGAQSYAYIRTGKRDYRCYDLYNIEEFDFCPKCKEVLRERCQECGEMEPIGRPSCRKEYENTCKKISEIGRRINSSTFPEWMSLSYMIVCFIIAVRIFITFTEKIISFIATSHYMVSSLSILIFMVLAALPSTWINIRLVKRMRIKVERETEKFWLENPELKVKYEIWQEWFKDKKQ